eukprot:TRINITY_DN4223_c0_g3_i1.p1 TRINITY_DN4223_c0_g3~~TRINITY_DN4223_c0_g3_i1.p1  ORF type:complete len:400 (+),score=116.68 TRINITY_DN4223_c0_g3_i1:77-1201(+)
MAPREEIREQPTKQDEPPVYSAPLKLAVAALLTLQNSAMVLTLRYAKTTAHFSSLRVVLVSEVVKLLLCCAVLLLKHGGLSQLGAVLRQEVWQDRESTLRAAIPAGLYLLQNNLLFYALGHLDAVLYQLTYQGKIITAAMFSVVILGRKLHPYQWVAVLTLTAGVILCQWRPVQSPQPGQSPSRGVTAVLVACFTSGLAGVYTEKMLKGATADLWVRNIQLALWSIVSGIVVLYSSERPPGLLSGRWMPWLFEGYTPAVWTATLMQGGAGILVAVVMKVADNIVKNFSVSVSVLLSAALSVPIFGFVPTVHLAGGGALILSSAALYSSSGAADCLSCPDVFQDPDPGAPDAAAEGGPPHGTAKGGGCEVRSAAV